jgi:hypothetical protein
MRRLPNCLVAASGLFASASAKMEDYPYAGLYDRCPIDAAVLRAAQDSSYSEGAIKAFDDPASSLLKGNLARGVLAKLKTP